MSEIEDKVKSANSSYMRLAQDYIPVASYEGGDLYIICPVCGYFYVHPSTIFRESDGKINIEFDCEAGHYFRYEFYFHKGNTIVQKVEGNILDP